MSRQRKWIIPDPTTDIQDVTNYLTVESQQLRPGVRLSSWYDVNGQPQISTSTTVGVLLPNGALVRMTCALHGWLNSNEVQFLPHHACCEGLFQVKIHPSFKVLKWSQLEPGCETHSD